eukprot:GHVL01010932.1.p1 GENE.GHVL01010932.1~~GHVL01010932.1.p1  ORF type:complete len:370 (-),score=16.06 GHVL01010932.1:851-1960(-)
MFSTAQGNDNFCLLLHGLLVVLPIMTCIIIIPVILQMILYTAASIYIGSHRSLLLNEIDMKTGKRAGETMSHKDAALFPIIGSAALFGLFLAMKFLGQYWVNMLLSSYLSILAACAVGETLVAILAPYMSEKQNNTHTVTFQLPGFLASKDGPYTITWSITMLWSYSVGAITAVSWLLSKSLILHNYLGICFAIQAIGMLSIRKFKIGAMLLCGLFVYDIFWVFGTSVMVSVAKSFEGPAKLLFPVSFDPWKTSLLGLGDIVIPGLFVSLALRFDHYLAFGETEKYPSKIDINSTFPKSHFAWVMVAYLLGLVTTGVAMLVFQYPQPALLYLVPFCLGSMAVATVIYGSCKPASVEILFFICIMSMIGG